MLERETLVTTTGTGPRPAPRPPPPKPLPPPPPKPPPLLLGAVDGSPACQTAYPATPAIISRKTTQIRPRFLGFPDLGGIGPCWPGRSTSGSDSGIFMFVVIQTPIQKRQTICATEVVVIGTSPPPDPLEAVEVTQPFEKSHAITLSDTIDEGWLNSAMPLRRSR